MFLLFSVGLLMAQTDAASKVDSSSAKSAGRALVYSFVPGGGQLYNGKPMKALLFSGTFLYFYIEYLGAQSDFESDPTSGSLHRTRNDKVWLMALTWTLNLIDAYVDASLWDFDKYPMENGELPEQEMIKPKETEKIDDDQ